MKPNSLTVHCSATPNGKDIGGAKTIDRWHKERGWRGCGYHYVLSPNGSKEHYVGGFCRALNQVGAHVGGHNLIKINGVVGVNVGICLVGTDKFSWAQWDSLYSILKVLYQSFDIAGDQYWVHNQFNSKKTCPGFTIQKLLTWFYDGNWGVIREHILS